MASVIRQVVRKYSTATGKNIFLMGTLERPVKHYDETEHLPSTDMIESHKAFYPCFVNEALKLMSGREFSGLRKRFEEVCYYTGPNRDLYPSYMLMYAYEAFEEPSLLTVERVKLVSVIGWCFEMVSTAAITTDDLMDNQQNRWKQPCWYKKPNIGCSAISDINLMRAVAYTLIKKIFRDHPGSTFLLKLISHMVMGISIGQVIDVNLTADFNRLRDIDIISMDMYLKCTYFKSHLPVIRVPALVSMHLTNQSDAYWKYDRLLCRLGDHVQIINDVWDCYGKYDTFGRPGSDIMEGRTSWVIIKACEHATAEQKKLLQDNYGRTDAKCERTVLDVYEEIGVLQRYYEYRRNLINDFRNAVEEMPNPKLRALVKKYISISVDVDDDIPS